MERREDEKMPFYLRAATPVDGWRRIVRRIMGTGMEREDERGIKTRWLDNVLIHVRNPYSERVCDEYPFSERVLREKYASQILSPDRLGFDYTYGERLNAWGKERINQIRYVISKLNSSPVTRRAVATTWDPRKDTRTDEVPCLNHFVFMVREGRLDLSVMIRSNDMYGAWLANVYALAELLRHVSHETRIKSGTITTLSVNAHIYEHDWDRAATV
ncbi:MAG: thymidylate synthase [Candidatus Thorarchaeota archaeon]|nr:MAG: thymidylate synthase [Candidatus Thorarchaeota archaeon]